jgi:hypothetical protein
MLLVLAAFLLTATALVRSVQRYGAIAGMGAWQALQHPPGEPARRWRNVALALALPIAMGLATLLNEMELLSRPALRFTLGLGAVLFVGALTMIVSSEQAKPRAVADRARLRTAVVVLVLWGVVCAVAGQAAEETALAAKWADAATLRARLYARQGASLEPFSANDLPAHAVYLFRLQPDSVLIASRVSDFPLIETLAETAAGDAGRTRRMASVLLQTNPGMSRDRALALGRTIQNGALVPRSAYVGEALQRYSVIKFGLNGAVYEVGFSYADERREIHQALVPYAAATLALTLLLSLEAMVARCRSS